MLLNPVLRTLKRSPFARRMVSASCVLGVLGLAGNGALLAKPVAPERIPTEQVRISPQPPASLAVGPSAESQPAPSPQPTSPPVEAAMALRPLADLSSLPPAPDPLRPAFAATVSEAALWSGPTGGQLFNRIPEEAIVRVLDRQDQRFRVFYPGDRGSRLPGEAWVDVTDLSGIPWPRWVRLRAASPVLARPAGDAAPLGSLEPGDFVEVVRETRGSWAHVYFLGDGRRPPLEGWLEAASTMPIPGPDVASRFALTRQQLAESRPVPWIPVPYRSQLDGSRYAAANCGPTTAGMVLEGFGFNVPQPQLRREVLSLQPRENCDDCGVYIQNLAEVMTRRGLTVVKLRDNDPERFHVWTLDEIREQLAAGRPVIAQVFYRGLPGRETAPYWGDHYIVLTGLLGDQFIHNDPIDSEGPGYSRLINAEALERAMELSDYPFAAFAVGR